MPDESVEVCMEERRVNLLVCFLTLYGGVGNLKVDTKGTRRGVVGRSCGNDEDRVFWKAGLVTLCRSIGRL